MTGTAMDKSYISSFCMELYLILQAGIPLSDGVEILAQDEENASFRQVLIAMAHKLQDGLPLYTALENTHTFPRHMIDMVQVGEETGNLDHSLKGLSLYYDRQAQLEQAVRKAVLFPALLLAMLTVVLVVLIVKVLPMFRDVYSQLGGTLTGLGALILDFGILLETHWLATFFVVVAVVVLLLIFVAATEKSGTRVLLSKKLGRLVAISKLAAALSMAIQSGLDIDHAMELAIRLTQHPELHQKLEGCAARMEQGDGFATAMAQKEIFPSLYTRMLNIGVRTGAMDEVMEDIARRCNITAQDAIDHYIDSIEPTLVVIMSFLVGVVLLSVMLPLASIMTALG